MFLALFPGAPKVRALAGVVVTFIAQAQEGVSSLGSFHNPLGFHWMSEFSSCPLLAQLRAEL